MVGPPQTALWCGCGRGILNARGVCAACARRLRLSRENFGGHRERVFVRDGSRARCCGALDDLLVHHRRPRHNVFRLMLLMCRRCHTRIHHTARPGFAFPEPLRELWRELHPEVTEQMRFTFVSMDVAPALENAVQSPLFEVAA